MKVKHNVYSIFVYECADIYALHYFPLFSTGTCDFCYQGQEGHFSFKTMLNRNYLVRENFEFLISLNTMVILKHTLAKASKKCI